MHPHSLGPQGPTLLMVPRCLAAACERGFDSDGCDALPPEVISQWHLLWPRLWRLVFSQHWTKISRYVHPVGVAPEPTRSGPQVTTPRYPGLSQFIW